MSKSLNIKMLTNACLNEDKSNINEQITRIKEKLDNSLLIKIPDQFKNQAKGLNKSIGSLQEAQAILKDTLTKVFPQIDAEKFIDIYIRGPINTQVLNVQFYDKLINIFIEHYKKDTSEEHAILPVRQHTDTIEEGTNSFVVPQEILKSLLKELTTLIISALMAFTINIYTSNTEDINNHTDQKFEEIVVEIDSLNQNNLKEIQNQINELMENQEEILNDHEEILDILKKEKE